MEPKYFHHPNKHTGAHRYCNTCAAHGDSHAVQHPYRPATHLHPDADGNPYACFAFANCDQYRATNRDAGGSNEHSYGRANSYGYAHGYTVPPK